MDKARAISHFLWHVDRYPQILLVTDDEVGELFGREVPAALAELERFNQAERLCADCGGVCCRDIGCELYVAQLGQCPIHDCRPLVCRFHFCHRFDALDRYLIIDLRDVFLGCLTATDFWVNARLRSLDIPPIAGVSPELVTAVTPWVEAARAGSVDPGRAVEMIRLAAQDFRSSCSSAV